ncbi:MAG: hypothetical protein KDA37_17215 [Planctomycetales bacterium]|nr:hypothetical protein [Planctomycetales bacterium]
MEQNDRRQKGALRLPIQKVIAVRLVVHWFAAAIVAIVLTLILQFFANPTLGAEEREAIRALTWGPMALAFLAAAPIAALDMARFSHSIAGPIVRLKRVVGELADGQRISPVKFRKNDHWHDLAAEFNRLSEEVARLRAIEQQQAADRPQELAGV